MICLYTVRPQGGGRGRRRGTSTVTFEGRRRTRSHGTVSFCVNAPSSSGGRKILQRRAFEMESAASEGAEVRGRGATGRNQSCGWRPKQQQRFITAEALPLFLVFVMLQTQFHPSILLIGPSHFITKPRPLRDGPAPQKHCCYFYLSLSFLPLFSFLFSARSECRPRPELRPPPLLSSTVPSSLSFPPPGDAAKRKAWKLNRVASLRSIYANSLHNSEGKKNKIIDPALTTPAPPT